VVFFKPNLLCCFFLSLLPSMPKSGQIAWKENSTCYRRYFTGRSASISTGCCSAARFCCSHLRAARRRRYRSPCTMPRPIKRSLVPLAINWAGRIRRCSLVPSKVVLSNWKHVALSGRTRPSPILLA